jgi:transposase-like protein
VALGESRQDDHVGVCSRVSPCACRDLGISDQSIYTWRRQDRIDRGPVPGLTSSEKAELATAKRRLAELETELRDPAGRAG